jgi:hypothetical protein
MLDLRAYFCVDRMQLQVAAYIGSTSRGFLPVSSLASLFIETRPGITITDLTDIAEKRSDVKSAMQIRDHLNLTNISEQQVTYSSLFFVHADLQRGV